MCCISFSICRAIGRVVVEIWLVYFSCTKADYVSEIPVVSGIPVQDVTSYPTAPANEILPAWTNCTSYSTAPASEIPPSWMNPTSYSTGTGACWKPIPIGVFWPHPSGASVLYVGRQPTPMGLNTTRRSLVPTTVPGIPSISSASDRYGGWSSFIGKWVFFCVVVVYQV